MKTYQILNHLEDVVKTITVNSIQEVENLIYNMREHHGFSMIFTYEEVSK
jgi:hypothetical protein